MTENKRDLLLRAMNNEETDRAACGFWHHFVVGPDQFRGLEDPEILERVVQGHKKYYEVVQPDMMKIMSEGFFGYPPIMNNDFASEVDLLNIKAVGPDHPWIQKQVAHVKRISNLFINEVMCFYNIFSPLQIIRIRFDFLDLDYDRFVVLAEKYPEAMLQAGLEIQKDVSELIRQLFAAKAIDGIYYCVQNVQSEMYDLETYSRIIRPTELPALEEANRLSDKNILHICGYDRHTNNFEYYKDYPARIYNWAVHTEKISLQEGKSFFNGACVLGGFDNNPGTLIDKGSPKELFGYVRELLTENGFRGYIVGADCSIPNDIDDQQVRYIRNSCHELSRKEVI